MMHFFSFRAYSEIINMYPLLGLGEVEDVVPMILFLISSNFK